LVGEQREIGRAWGEVSASEKISGKFPRVAEIYGVKEKLWCHLAAKREPLGVGGRRNLWGALRPTMCESMATVGFLELEIWCTKVCI